MSPPSASPYNSAPSPLTASATTPRSPRPNRANSVRASGPSNLGPGRAASTAAAAALIDDPVTETKRVIAQVLGPAPTDPASWSTIDDEGTPPLLAQLESKYDQFRQSCVPFSYSLHNRSAHQVRDNQVPIEQRPARSRPRSRRARLDPRLFHRNASNVSLGRITLSRRRCSTTTAAGRSEPRRSDCYCPDARSVQETNEGKGRRRGLRGRSEPSFAAPERGAATQCYSLDNGRIQRPTNHRAPCSTRAQAQSSPRYRRHRWIQIRCSCARITESDAVADVDASKVIRMQQLCAAPCPAGLREASLPPRNLTGACFD